jgi:hypothetical protein
MGNFLDSQPDVDHRISPKLSDPVYKCRVLLLGTGGSGKSTLWFQFEKLNNAVDENLVHAQSFALRLNLFNYLARAYSVSLKNDVAFSCSEAHDAGTALKDAVETMLGNGSTQNLDMKMS